MINKVLPKYKNVEIKYSANVEGYKTEKNIVKSVIFKESNIPGRSVNFSAPNSIDCDVVVLCNSPEAPYHIWENFGCILPSI
jgi:hypothetical protein